MIKNAAIWLSTLIITDHTLKLMYEYRAAQMILNAVEIIALRYLGTKR